MIAEVKDPSKDGESVITLGALNEIKAYVDKMATASAEIEGKKVLWTDVCNKAGSQCIGMNSLLSFG